MDFCPQKLSLFTPSFPVELKKSILTKSTIVQTVMVLSGKYEMHGYLMCQIEVCPFYKTDAAEFFKELIANKSMMLEMHFKPK